MVSQLKKGNHIRKYTTIMSTIKNTIMLIGFRYVKIKSSSGGKYVFN